MRRLSWRIPQVEEIMWVHLPFILIGLSLLCSSFGSSILCQNIALTTRWSFVWMPYAWWVNYKAFFLYLWMGGDFFCFWASLRSTLHTIMDFAQRKEKSTSTNFEVFVRTTTQELLSSMHLQLWNLGHSFGLQHEARYGIQEFYAEEFLQSFEVEFKFSAHQWLMRMLFLHIQRARDEKPKKMSKFSNFICIARPFDCLSFLDLYGFYSWQLNFSLSVIFSLINAIPISRRWMQIGLYRW